MTGTQKTVLIVDDEAALTKAVAFDFKRRGFLTFTASGGKEAFAIVQREKIDVVISDIRMPDGDGVELLNRIKTLNHEFPVVIFMTGFADMTIEEAYEQGADAVFSKPFDRKALLAAVDRALLPRSERWAIRPERIGVELKIELQFPELRIAVRANLLNIGRGGIFVALGQPFPTLGTFVEFKILLSAGKPGSIEGHGIVRWVRTQQTESYPPGVGIEFKDLGDTSRQQVIELINDLKTRIFIPRH